MSKLSQGKKTHISLMTSHSEEFIAKISARMSGSNNPMFARPVTDTNKKLISLKSSTQVDNFIPEFCLRSAKASAGFI